LKRPRAAGSPARCAAGSGGTPDTGVALRGDERSTIVTDYQDVLFKWAVAQSPLTGATILAAGLLYGFQGFRFARLLLPLSTGVMAFGIGWIAGDSFRYPPALVGTFAAVVLALLVFVHGPTGQIVCGGLTFALLGYYLATRFTSDFTVVAVLVAIGTAFGAAGPWLMRRTLPVLLSTIHGSALLVLGFVSLATAVAPSLGSTFRSWAASVSLMVPMLVLMLTLMAYSFQANAQQGDMTTGSRRASAGLRA
jgi:hypothetical protein